ncbi:hypothetical protein N9L76_04395 [bacterium]|nr:hypothetical protein [bacterium]
MRTAAVTSGVTAYKSAPADAPFKCLSTVSSASAIVSGRRGVVVRFGEARVMANLAAGLPPPRTPPTWRVSERILDRQVVDLPRGNTAGVREAIAGIATCREVWRL